VKITVPGSKEEAEVGESRDQGEETEEQDNQDLKQIRSMKKKNTSHSFDNLNVKKELYWKVYRYISCYIIPIL
jgi:hypothetical protein